MLVGENALETREGKMGLNTMIRICFAFFKAQGSILGSWDEQIAVKKLIF